MVVVYDRVRSSTSTGSYPGRGVLAKRIGRILDRGSSPSVFLGTLLLSCTRCTGIVGKIDTNLKKYDGKGKLTVASLPLPSLKNDMMLGVRFG